MVRSSVDQTLNLFDRFAEEGKARLISDLGNPLLMPPAVMLGACLLLGEPILNTLIVVTTAVVCYTLLPFGLTLYLFNTGMIDSLDLPLRETRTVLYAFSIVTAAIAPLVIYFLMLSAHPFLFILALVFLANLSIAFLLNLKWKVSVHSASVAVAGTVYGIMFLWQITFFPVITLILSLLHLLLLLPVVMWARHHLSVHSVTELLGGTVAGVLLTLIELNIFMTLW